MISIAEAKSRRDNIEVEGIIKELSEPRTVKTKYGDAQVCDAYLTDDQDRIKLTLWGDDIKKVNNGDKVQIRGGYTNEFRNEIQLSVPRKNGEITVVKSDS